MAKGRKGKDGPPPFSMDGDLPPAGSDEPTAPTASSGSQAPRCPGHRIKGQIGRGGFGRVYLAREDAVGRDVALKLPASAAPADTRRLQRFLEEARVTAQLQHPGIVPVYHLGRDRAGRPYYTMRPVEGESLKSILARLRAGEEEAVRRYPLRRLVEIFHSVCQTVRFAHDRGVIHRDLKPGNVVVGEYGEVVVIDWGVAKVLAEEEAASQPAAEKGDDVWLQYQRRVESLRGASDSTFEVTQDGASIGTPSYMSPEQALGHTDEVDVQSDLWALGVILYELCTLRLPFEADSLADLAQLVTTADPPDPATVDPKRLVEPQLATIALRCLKRDRSERYATAAELAQEIRDWLDGVAATRLIADIHFADLLDGEPRGWTAVAGSWRVAEGLLAHEGLQDGALILDTPAAGDVRVEVEAMVLPERNGEISIFMNAPAPGTGSREASDDGYCLQFGADYNTCCKIAKDGNDVMTGEASCVPGQWHHLVAERTGEAIVLTADGEELLRWRDQMPLAGEHVGLYVWGDGLRVRRFRVFGRDVPTKVSCLAVPHAFYNEGLFDKAKREYLRLARSHKGREEGLEALFLAGRCCVELAQAASQDEAGRQGLLAEASELFDRLEATRFAPLGCLGKSLLRQLEGDLQVEADELVRAYREYPDHARFEAVGERLWDRANECYDNMVNPFVLPAARFYPAGFGGGRHMSMLSLCGQEAEAVFRHLAEALSDWPAKRCNAHIGLGVVLRRQGRFTEAIEAFETAERLFPQRSFDARLECAATLRCGGRSEEALPKLHALRQQPAAAGQMTRLRMEIMRVLLDLGDDARAEEICRELADDPGTLVAGRVTALGYLAAICGRAGRWDEAIAANRQALLLNVPGRLLVAPAVGAAYVLCRLGRHEEALAEMRRLEKHPNGAWAALLGTALTHLMRGEPDRARESLERLARLGMQAMTPAECRAVLEGANETHQQPRSPGDAIFRALVAWTDGDRQAAARYLCEYLANPSGQKAPQIAAAARGLLDDLTADEGA